MEKYIKALLASDSRVIIPNLGAIQALRDDAEVSLSFNPYLNFNDGKLTQAIADGEGISNDEAAERLKSIVEKVIDRMNSGERVTLAGIGSFFRSESGATTEFEADSNYSEESTDAPSPISFDEPTTATSDSQSQDSTTSNDDNEPKPAPFEPETPAENKSESSYSYDDDSEEKKSKKWPWVLLVLLLLLIGLGLLLLVFNKDNAVYRFVFRDKIRTEQVEAEAKAKAAAKAKAEAEAKAKAEREAAEKAKAEEEAAKAKKSFDPGSAQKLTKRYNIIVGSYKTESAAAAKVSDLRAKGYDEAFVGYRKEHFVAVIGAFTSIAAAESMQEKIVDGPYHIESWITNSGE